MILDGLGGWTSEGWTWRDVAKGVLGWWWRQVQWTEIGPEAVPREAFGFRCKDVDNSDCEDVATMRSTCPQTKYLFDTEGTPILSEEVSSGWKWGVKLRVECWHFFSSWTSIFCCKGQRSRFGNRDQGNCNVKRLPISISIGAWRDAHQKCFGARTLSSLPASLRLWEGIPVDSCWLGKKYVPPVLSFSREILTFLYCFGFPSSCIVFCLSTYLIAYLSIHIFETCAYLQSICRSV